MTEHKVIRKERIHLMCPCAQVCAVAAFDKIVERPKLLAAIQNVVKQHQILSSRVYIEADGTALFGACNDIEIELHDLSVSVEELIAKQIVFALDRGETVRFFCRQTPSRTEMVVLAHHIVCDGGSMMILLKDILSQLNGQDVSYKPIQLLTPKSLPEHPRLNLAMRLMMKSVGARWRKSGKVFTWEDRDQLRRKYAESHPRVSVIRQIGGDGLSRVIQIAKQQGVTVNSLIVAAIAEVWPADESIGIAVSVRPKDFIGMGDYATGVSIRPNGDALAIHRQIIQKLNSPKDLYFLYEFMNSLPPTLVDGIYFSRYMGYDNPIAQSAAKMCGFIDAPTGVSTTNLTAIDMPDNPDDPYSYADVYFLPPYMPNVRGIIGISSYRDTMTLTFSTEINSRWPEEQKRFEKLCDMLNNMSLVESGT